MTRMRRLENVEMEAPEVRYFIVNVLLPGVRPPTPDRTLALLSLPVATRRFIRASVSVSARVVAPETSKVVRAVWPEVSHTSWAVTNTNALVPVVRVTDGPAVAGAAAL